jgi:hypothetical protein
VAARVSDLRALIHPSAWKKNSRKLNIRFTEFSEVQTIPIDSLSLLSESPAIVCLFGARRLSQHNLILSFPSPEKVAPTGSQHIPQTYDFCRY